MFTVHIYAESDSITPKCVQRYAGYVIEYKRKSGETETREEFESTIGTMHAVILQELIKAIKRLTKSCVIYIHTQDTYILDMIDKCLEKWEQNGYRSAKGELIKNHFEWEKFSDAIDNHLIALERGKHSYYFWMMNKMATLKKADKDEMEKADARSKN